MSISMSGVCCLLRHQLLTGRYPATKLLPLPAALVRVQGWTSDLLESFGCTLPCMRLTFALSPAVGGLQVLQQGLHPGLQLLRALLCHHNSLLGSPQLLCAARFCAGLHMQSMRVVALFVSMLTAE